MQILLILLLWVAHQNHPQECMRTFIRTQYLLRLGHVRPERLKLLKLKIMMQLLAVYSGSMDGVTEEIDFTAYLVACMIWVASLTMLELTMMIRSVQNHVRSVLQGSIWRATHTIRTRLENILTAT